jgi:phosphoglycolate phosphatase
VVAGPGCAVFDLDGTLVDSVPTFAEVLNAMLDDRRADARLSHEAIRPHATAGGLAMVAALLGDHCGDVHLALAEFRERYAAGPTPPESLYPGVREGLEALRAGGVSLAVFSNKPQHLCDKVLSELGLAPMLAAIVGTAPGVPLKPDPTGLDLALNRAGAERARSCYIGDSDADYTLARQAGVPMILASWGYGETGRAWPEALIAEGFSEVPSLVSRVLSPEVSL